MDANGLRFWMLADLHRRRPDGSLLRDAGGAPVSADWTPVTLPSHLAFDERRRVLRLASERAAPSASPPDDPRSVATQLLELVPACRDAFRTYAAWRPGDGRIMAGGAGEGEVPIDVPLTGPPSDLAMGHDGVLYVASDGAVILVDRRGRWLPVRVEEPGFTAWRVAADPAGGVWVLDRAARRLGRLTGMPFPDRAYRPRAAADFGPEQENPNPPRLVPLPGVEWPADEEPVALACLEPTEVAVLAWTADDSAAVRRLDPVAGVLGRRITLDGAVFPYSAAWVAPGKLAVLSLGLEAPAAPVPGLEREALVYALPETEPSALPVGDLYPLQDAVPGPFLHGVELPPHYPTAGGSAPLHPVSFPSFARRTEVVTAEPIDSTRADTVWHRVYLEATLPAGTGVQLFLAASDDRTAPADASAWYEHRFGQPAAPGGPGVIPRGAWVPYPSEIPFHEGFLSCPRERDRSGLFTVLVQRAGRRVRALRGRYLWARMVLTGDGRTTPEVAAVRIYASRFSYLDRYLPELYRERVFGPDADEAAPSERFPTATPSDFLGRFLANIEGVLTPIEDRIAHAHRLTDPRTAPDGALEWLGSWIGMTFDPRFPADRRRRLLVDAPRLCRRRGTLEGLRLAIDAVANDAVAGGEVVVVEDFRLRRTFATILGANLADEADPLLAGLTVSGNSYVGDTLFLGDEFRRELIALFDAGGLSPDEREEVRRFFDRLAHRVTVLVHDRVEPRDLGLIRRVVELETPAHVSARVVTATYPFLVGVAALIGVDTYLGPAARPDAVRLDRSTLGARDVVQRLASLDPRLGRSLS